jgi:uncharacterized membrane protein YdjX (TVP38/TMEM64 family)
MMEGRDVVSTPERRPLRAARILALVAVGAGLALAWRMGVLDRLAEPRSLARSLVEMGAWGWVAFVVAYTLVQPFGVPGTIFVVAAPLIWPWQTAFVLSMIGTMGASVVGFSFARFIARDWIAARIPARLRRYDEALERNAFRTVFLLRLIFWMPQVLHTFFGVSKVRFRTHFWGSLLGYIAPLFLISYLGSEIFDASGHMQPRAWPIMGGMVVASALLVLGVRHWERRSRATRTAST